MAKKHVEIWQMKLSDLGLYYSTIDGDFGPATLQASLECLTNQEPPSPVIDLGMFVGSKVAAAIQRAERVWDAAAIHTAASPDNADSNAAAIDAYHKSKGWKGIGYHLFIRKDGRVELGRSLEEDGAHVSKMNSELLGICCAGNGDIADFTNAQKVAIVELFADFFPHIIEKNIVGHRETPELGGPEPYKTCPGMRVDMNEIRNKISRARTF